MSLNISLAVVRSSVFLCSALPALSTFSFPCVAYTTDKFSLPLPIPLWQTARAFYLGQIYSGSSVLSGPTSVSDRVYACILGARLFQFFCPSSLSQLNSALYLWLVLEEFLVPSLAVAELYLVSVQEFGSKMVSCLSPGVRNKGFFILVFPQKQWIFASALSMRGFAGYPPKGLRLLLNDRR